MFVSLKILLVPVAAGTHDLHPAEHHLVRPIPDQRGGGPAVGHVVLQVGAVGPEYVMLHVELFIVLLYCIVVLLCNLKRPTQSQLPRWRLSSMLTV